MSGTFKAFLTTLRDYRYPKCPACGVRTGLNYRPVLWPELVEEWGLTPAWAKWFDEREGFTCKHCGCRLRERTLADAIRKTAARLYGIRATSLKELVGLTPFQEKHVAEINSAGDLHQFLKELAHLSYSEYGTQDPRIRSENLLSLSYPDNAFDVVITSETLEHVPDIDRALQEIARVLKPDGAHIFTVPIVTAWESTRQRARTIDGKVIHDLPPSFHGSPGGRSGDLLVFYEFGKDFLARCRAAGFAITLHQSRKNPALVAIVAQK